MNKKLTVLAAMLVMAVLSIPAMAQGEPGPGDKAAGGGSPEPPVEAPALDSPEPPAEAPVVDSVEPEQPVASPEPPVEAPAVDSGSPEPPEDPGPPAEGPSDSAGPEPPDEAPPTGGEVEPEAGDPVIGTSSAEWREDQKADRDDRRDRDGKAGTDQRDRRNDDCRPGDRGFPFFCDRDDDDDNGVDQEIDQDAESGDVDQEIDISLSGDNSNQCVAILQAANTGNNQNAQGIAQDDSEAEDVELEGGGIIIAPELVQDCRQVIQQTAVAGGRSERQTRLKPGVVGAAPKGAVPPARGAGPAAVGAPMLGRPLTGQPLAGQPAARPGALPRTGGILGGDGALLGLGLGTLLIGGGLLARRIF